MPGRCELLRCVSDLAADQHWRCWPPAAILFLDKVQGAAHGKPSLLATIPAANIDFSSCSATFFGAKQEPGVVDLNEGLDPVGGGKLGVATPEVY